MKAKYMKLMNGAKEKLGADVHFLARGNLILLILYINQTEV